MHNHIKEIAVAAGFNPYNYEGGNSKLFERFVELIVKECANIAREADSENVFGAGMGYDIAYQIEERFGMK